MKMYVCHKPTIHNRVRKTVHNPMFSTYFAQTFCLLRIMSSLPKQLLTLHESAPINEGVNIFLFYLVEHWYF